MASKQQVNITKVSHTNGQKKRTTILHTTRNEISQSVVAPGDWVYNFFPRATTAATARRCPRIRCPAPTQRILWSTPLRSVVPSSLSSSSTSSSQLDERAANRFHHQSVSRSVRDRHHAPPSTRPHTNHPSRAETRYLSSFIILIAATTA